MPAGKPLVQHVIERFADKVNGRVTYSQEILGEYGLIDRPTGRGVATKGSGYSQI